MPATIQLGVFGMRALISIHVCIGIGRDKLALGGDHLAGKDIDDFV
jgi:hypothetical protein